MRFGGPSLRHAVDIDDGEGDAGIFLLWIATTVDPASLEMARNLTPAKAGGAILARQFIGRMSQTVMLAHRQTPMRRKAPHHHKVPDAGRENASLRSHTTPCTLTP